MRPERRLQFSRKELVGREYIWTLLKRIKLHVQFSSLAYQRKAVAEAV